jgi:hypothetical protein
MRCHKWLHSVMGILSALMMAFPARSATSIGPSPSAAATRLGNLASPYAARTAADFVLACASDQMGCDGKVAAVLMSRMQFSPTAHICLSGPSYAAAIAPWLKAHPQMAAMDADNAIFLAISALYKCGPPNNY